MKYSTAIVLAAGAFLIIGYFVYTKTPASPTESLAPGALAFPELATAPDSTPTTAPTAPAQTKSSSATPPSTSSTRTPPAGAKEYQSTAYHFSLLYPQELAVSERPEGGGASTITFQNVDTAEGFQIFIVPYSEAQVSGKRFREDEPSGVRDNLTNITVDGATAAAFYSENIALGATREVWVVHGGFLYEITTLKSLDTWLGEIIKTWKFTP